MIYSKRWLSVQCRIRFLDALSNPQTIFIIFELFLVICIKYFLGVLFVFPYNTVKSAKVLNQGGHYIQRHLRWVKHYVELN